MSKISDEFSICLKVFEFNKNNKPIWFSKLVEELDRENDRCKVSDQLDRLFDLGMLNGKWENVGGQWKRTLSVTGEFSGFVKGLYNTTKSDF